LKSRVLVGVPRAHKDVDLARLKQIKDEFSYQYGRQQEVVGIGASDPDTITNVLTIDAEGEGGYPSRCHPKTRTDFKNLKTWPKLTKQS
jgi:hypothetical protein